MLILSACTQSKRGILLSTRRLRAHTQRGEAASAAGVAKAWAGALAESPGEALPIENLYKGAYWSAVLGLRKQMSGARLAVVSAGLGLVEGSASHASYSATFGSGHLDSVPGAENSKGRTDWWRLLGGSAALRARAREASPVIVVLPNRYLEVVADDLMAADRGQVVVFATSAPIRLTRGLGSRLIPLNSRMVRRLGTNVGALAPTAAQYLLSKAGGATDISRIHRLLGDLSSPNEAPLYPVRSRQTPAQVAEWLEAVIGSPAPPSSATAALRAFRASGRAFEQKHFHRLYREITEAGAELS